MENWNEKKSVHKGMFGEKIIKNYLESHGFIIYHPSTSGPHAFDFLAIKNKKRVIIVEVKTKAKLNKYDKTGIDTKHYNEYKFISKKHNISVFIFFVDEMLQEVYGNFLENLNQNAHMAPWSSNIILFNMSDMVRNIYKLNSDEVLYLKNKSTRSYNYCQ